MSEFIPGAEHVEVLNDKPGLCPDCLSREIDGRGGGKVQLVARDGKWVCPRSGPSLAQQYAKEGLQIPAVAPMGMWMLPTFAFTLGGGWLFRNWFRRTKEKASTANRSRDTQ
jgi:hypothetical protein